MKVGLFFHKPNKIVGCFKVIFNLMEGLKLLGHTIVTNDYGDATGCLQGYPGMMGLKPETLIGPEIMVLPTDNKEAWERFVYWTQPSQWVIDYMKTFKETEDANFYAWPVGIDTNRFNDDNRNIKQDCFIYYKNVTNQTPIEKLRLVEKTLKDLNLTYSVITYGEYTEDMLIDQAKKSRFAIFLVGTESQGLAYMETLSMGTPILIWDDMRTFKYGNYSFTNKNVSSAPYWDKRCGMKSTGLLSFLNKLNRFNPREFIVENHTLKMGAQKYVDILEKINV